MRYGSSAAALAAMMVLAAGGAAAQREVRRDTVVEIRRGTDTGRGWIGITFRSVEENGTGSVVVASVLPGSPAARAGVAAGDTVVRVDGATADDDAVSGLRRRLKPGDTVRLRVRHGGAEAERSVVAAARPGQNFTITNGVVRISGDDGREPVIIRLDSLGSIADRHVRQVLDSVGIELHGLPEMLEGQRREFRVMVDSLRGPARVFRVHMDSMRRDLDSLSFRLDTLRSHLRRMHVEGDGGDRDVEVVIARDAQARARSEQARARVGQARAEAMANRDRARAEMPFFLDIGRRALGGAEMVDLDDRLGSYFSARHGALVVKVSPRTPAARAGLEPGDVVVRVGDRAVSSVAELRSAASRSSEGRVRLQVLRHGRRRDLEMQWDRGAMDALTTQDARERVEIRTRVREDVKQR